MFLPNFRAKTLLLPYVGGQPSTFSFRLLCNVSHIFEFSIETFLSLKFSSAVLNLYPPKGLH